MAELHGELMEFQESLQRQLSSKETYINRLKRELISLRGPLPEEISPFSFSEQQVADRDETKRPLINIWIPSVFEGGKGTDSHHIYQVR